MVQIAQINKTFYFPKSIYSMFYSKIIIEIGIPKIYKKGKIFRHSR